MKQRAAMTMALEALEANMQDERVGQWRQMDDACTALREALAQPQDHREQHLNMVQGEWVDLTDDELLEIAEIDGSDDWFFKVMNSVIVKFKEKNTPPVVPQEPDCYAVLTPLGSRLVSPEEAKGRVMAYPLYTTPPSVEAAVEATKEKAAKVCENVICYHKGVAKLCAAAIRSMK